MNTWNMLMLAFVFTPVPLKQRGITGESQAVTKMPKDYEGKKKYKREYYREYHAANKEELNARKRTRRRKAATARKAAQLKLSTQPINNSQEKESNHVTS